MRNRCRDGTHLGMPEAQYGVEEAIMIGRITLLFLDVDLGTRCIGMDRAISPLEELRARACLAENRRYRVRVEYPLGKVSWCLSCRPEKA